MLALTRKKGESLVINNNIEITLYESAEIRSRSEQCTEGSAGIPQEVYLPGQNENKAALNATEQWRR